MTRAFLIGFFVAIIALFSLPAHAARTVNAVVLTYGAQVNVTAVTVPPGATIAATVNVTHTGTGQTRRWYSTSWRIGGGAFTCVDHTQFNTDATDSVTFNITAPAGPGTYNVEFIAWQAAGCSSNSSPTFTLANGVTVVAVDNSTVTASPTSVSADGFSTSTITVTIRDAANNPVAGKTVSLAALSGSSSISAASGPSGANGVVTFAVSDTTVESVTYRATNVTDGIVLTQTATVSFTAPVVTFNAVEVGANAFSGRIFTKVAGVAFSLDIYARTGGIVFTAFTGAVRVEIVDASGGGACAALPLIQALPNQTFVIGNNGRRTVAGIVVANAYRDARVRIGSPAAAPTTISCSSDNFAIRPNVLTWAVTNATRTTAGTVNALTNTALPGPAAAVHNAGRPFTVRATAYNGAGVPAITSNYDGTPTATVSACAGAACTATTGTFAPGAWSAAAGTVTTNTATYDDVGAFTLQLADDTFAAVDAGDGTPAATRTVPSAAAPVGRFVPERFVLSAASITPRADIVACATSTFTYMDERMDAAYTLTAARFPAGTTTRYSGALARLVLTAPTSFGFGAIDAVAPTPLTARLDTSGGTNGAWVNGSADVVAALALQRALAPDGPYTDVRIGIAPTDPDGVTLDPASLDLDADNSGSNERAQIGGASVLRFGRLRLQNGHGSQLIQMPLAVQAQYWNGTAFVTNTADSCTPLAVSNIALGNYRRNLSAGETTVSTSGTLVAGVGTVRLSAPGAANDGSVDVSINLTNAAPAGASCTAGMAATTPAARSYLQGAWCGATYANDPTARATFGVFRGGDRVIFQRESY